MTVTRSNVVTVARKWLGTPYQHQSSLQGIGCDCLGLVRGVWRECFGAEPAVPPPYTAHWAEALEQETLLEAAQQYLCEIPLSKAREGDVLLFRMGLGCPAKHIAIMTETSVDSSSRIIHTYWGKAVCETRLVPWWCRRIAGAFSFPDIED